jgi:hypothetical protein
MTQNYYGVFFFSRGAYTARRQNKNIVIAVTIGFDSLQFAALNIYAILIRRKTVRYCSAGLP